MLAEASMLYQVIEIEKMSFNISGTHSEQNDWVSEPVNSGQKLFRRE